MKVYGHRGASGYAPENTMEAFQMAIEMGADAIELDVQLTKDEQLVIFHDNKMQRTARWADGTPVTGQVREYTLEQIQQMEVGSWKSEEYKGAKIPTMEQVYQWMQQNEAEVNIEIKVPDGGYRKMLTEKTLEMAKAYGVEERLIISSFCHPALVDSHSQSPAIPTGILYSETLYRPEEYAVIVGAEALHPHFLQINAESVQACHAKGKIVNVWTPNTEEELTACIQMGVDGIITNYPDRALALLAQ